MSQAKHLILSAITKRTETFRAREIVADTGLSKQLVNYHLREWEKRGFIARNPLNTSERVLVDLASLLEELTSSSEYDGSKTYHMRDKHAIFNPESVNQLRESVDTYVALKYLDFKTGNYKKVLEDYIDKAIEELRRERAYMHNKKMAERTAAKYLLKNIERVDTVPGIDTGQVQEKCCEILVKEEKGLRLIINEEATEEETPEPEEIDPETLPEVKEARRLIDLYVNNLKMPDHGYVEKSRKVLEKYGLKNE